MGDLERQLRVLATGWGEQVPPVDASAVGARVERRRRRRRSMVAMAAAVVLVAGAGSVWWWNQSDETEVRTIDGAEVMTYQRVEYRQVAELTCDEPVRSPADGTDEMVFETWAAPGIGRWRQTVTYPDGATRSLVVADDPVLPTAAWSDGDRRGAVWACGADVQLIEQGWDSLFLLERPLSVDPADEIVVIGADSRGRESEIRTERITGTYRVAVDAGEQPVLQLDSTFADPITGLVHERTFRQESPAIGTVSWTATLTETASLAVDPELFSVDGFDTVELGYIDDDIIEATSIAPPFELGADGPLVGASDDAGEFARSVIAELTGWDDIEIVGADGGGGPTFVTLSPPPPGRPVDVLVAPTGDDAWAVIQISTDRPMDGQRAGPLGQVVLELPALDELASVTIVAGGPDGSVAWTATAGAGDSVLLPGSDIPAKPLVIVGHDSDGRTLAVWGEVDPVSATAPAEPASRELVRSTDFAEIYAETDPDGDVCLVVVYSADSEASTCAPRDLVAEEGLSLVGRDREDDPFEVIVLVPDGVTQVLAGSTELPIVDGVVAERLDIDVLELTISTSRGSMTRSFP